MVDITVYISPSALSPQIMFVSHTALHKIK